MKLSAERNTLAAALKHAARFSDPKSPIAIYACVKLAAVDNTLTVTAHNSTFAFTMRVPLEVTEPGEACVPAARIADLVASLRPDPPVVIEHRDQRLTIRSGATRAALGALDPASFPVSVGLFSAPQITITAGEMDRLLGLTLPAMGDEDISRMMLWGMALRYSRDGALALSCDGFFGAVCLVHHQDELGEFPGVILPRPVCVRLRGLLKEVGGKVTISITPRLARISAGDWDVTTKLIDSQFPDHTQWMAKRVEQPVVANAEALCDILARIDASTDFDNQKLKQRGAVATVEGGRMQVRDGHDVITDEMEVEYSGDLPVRIGFNTAQLREALEAIAATEIELHYRDRDSSILLCAKGELDYSFTTTPYRV